MCDKKGGFKGSPEWKRGSLACSAGWEPPPHTHAGRERVSIALPPSPCPQHPAIQSHTGGSLTPPTHTHTHTHTHTLH